MFNVKLMNEKIVVLNVNDVWFRCLISIFKNALHLEKVSLLQCIQVLQNLIFFKVLEQEFSSLHIQNTQINGAM